MANTPCDLRVLRMEQGRILFDNQVSDTSAASPQAQDIAGTGADGAEGAAAEAGDSAQGAAADISGKAQGAVASAGEQAHGGAALIYLVTPCIEVVIVNSVAVQTA